jgi:putative transposase
MVTDPALYRWSSYRANALGEADTLVTPHALDLGLGDDEQTRRATYRELFRIAIDDQTFGALRLALNQDQPVGNDRFYPVRQIGMGRHASEILCHLVCRQRGQGRRVEISEGILDPADVPRTGFRRDLATEQEIQVPVPVRRRPVFTASARGVDSRHS